MYWIYLAEDAAHWQALLIVVMGFRVP